MAKGSGSGKGSALKGFIMLQGCRGDMQQKTSCHHKLTSFPPKVQTIILAAGSCRLNKQPDTDKEIGLCKSPFRWQRQLEKSKKNTRIYLYFRSFA